jgi:predicted transposase/invertase (TIGR01784 family)
MLLSKFLDPKNDIAFRRIFGTEKNKDILIHFINDILELKDKNRVSSVTFLSTIQDPEIACKKQSIVDVLCRDENGVQIIVEMQVSPQEGFEKRAQYYAAKAYSRQLNRGSEEGARYKDLKAVIFIAILDNVVFPEKLPYKSDHVILDKVSYANDLKDFSFTFIELPKFKITDINLLTNIIEKWCYFFKNAYSTKERDLHKLVGLDEIIERAYEELNQFNWSEDELLLYEKEIKRIMDNRAAEDYKLAQEKYRLEQAEARGMQVGIEKGVKQGIEQGKINRNIEIVKTMIIQDFSVEQISKITELPEPVILDIKKNLRL